MKTLALIAFALTTAQAHAGVVQPTKDQIKPSTVEHVFNVQKESTTAPAIRLIQVDNGGSTDISSLTSPSRLYATIHKDGEMFNIDGNYLALDAVGAVQSVKLTGSRIVLTYEVLNERLKKETKSATIDLSQALKEAANARGEDFVDYDVKAAISVQ